MVSLAGVLLSACNDPIAIMTERAIELRVFIFLQNVRAMATPLAGCGVERGVDVGITWRHRREEGASGGCHPRLVSPLILDLVGDVCHWERNIKSISHRQCINSEIYLRRKISNMHHAGAGTHESGNRRITQDSEITNMNHV